MFSPWIKRSALKRSAQGRSLVANGVPVDMIKLVVLSALFVSVGIVVVAATRAATLPEGGGVPFATSSPSTDPSVSPSASVAP